MSSWYLIGLKNSRYDYDQRRYWSILVLERIEELVCDGYSKSIVFYSETLFWVEILVRKLIQFIFIWEIDSILLDSSETNSFSEF